MKRLLPALAGASMLLPGAAGAAEIARYKESSPLPILLAVSVPAGSDTLYISGQIASPVDPSTPFSPTLSAEQMGDTRTQTISALGKIKAALQAHGYRMSDVIKLTVFLVGDPKAGGRMDFAGMNAGYQTFFGTTENPNMVTRSAVQVAGLAGPAFLVEIEAIAARAKR